MMEAHRCGGNLVPTELKVYKRIGSQLQGFRVEGFKCDNCGEEVITRDVAAGIDAAVAKIKQQWRDWRVPAETRETPLPSPNWPVYSGHVEGEG